MGTHEGRRGRDGSGIFVKNFGPIQELEVINVGKSSEHNKNHGIDLQGYHMQQRSIWQQYDTYANVFLGVLHI